MRLIPFVLALALLIPPTADAARQPSVVPDQLLVKLAASTGVEAEDAAILSAASARLGLGLRFVRSSVLGWSVVEVQAQTEYGEPELTHLAERLAALPQVSDVVLNRRLRPRFTPSDPDWSTQWWASDSIDLPTAWDFTSSNAATIIAVVDEGTLQHEDIAAGIIGGYDFISDSYAANDGDGRDADYTDEGSGADCGEGWQDSSWHGTSVSGAAAARANNGFGIAGPAFSASVVSVRVLGRCGGSLLDIIEGAYWAGGGTVPGVPANPNPARVVNLSLGSLSPCDTASQDVFAALNGLNVVVVSASGNDGQDGAESWPGACNFVLDVASHGSEDYLACYSNYSSDVDLVAPGGDIDYYESNDAGLYLPSGPSNSSYAWIQGTSFAAPVVSGVVAQILALNPAWNLQQVQDHLQAYGRTVQCWNGGAPGQDNCRDSAGWAACNKPGLDAGSALTNLPIAGPTDDSYEENDNAGQAASVGCPGTITGEANDVDWFAVQLISQGSISADLTWSGGADLDLYLHDQGEQELDWSENESGNSEEVEGTSLSPGTYYVVMSPFAGSGSYSLALDCTGAAGDDDDDDDDDTAGDDDDASGDDDDDTAGGDDDDASGDDDDASGDDDDASGDDDDAAVDDDDDGGGGGSSRSSRGAGCGCSSGNSGSSHHAALTALIVLFAARRRRIGRGESE